MKFLLFSAAAATSLLFTSGLANAADLGGDCCSDLEERVAELEATTARKGNRKVSLYIYGQVNQAVMYWDDQRESNLYQVTNSTTKNILGFEGKAAISPIWTAGYRIELELRAAGSDFVDQGSTNALLVNNRQGPTQRTNGLSDEGLNGFVVRHSHWWLKNNRYGKITVGTASQATDGIAEIDLSGSTVVALSSVETWNEGYFLQDSQGLSPSLFATSLGGAGASIASLTAANISIASLYVDIFRGNFDGGRANVVRYDTPTIAGFIFSTSWGEDDDWDVGLRYAGTWGDFRVAGGAGYRSGVTTDTDNFSGSGTEYHQNVVVGSGSLMHLPTGLFAVVAGGRRQWEEIIQNGVATDLQDFILDDKYVYLKAGVFRRFLPYGKTSFYGEYYKVWGAGVDPTSAFNNIGNGFDAALFDEEAHVWGIGVVQHIDAAAMEIYLAYRHYVANDINNAFFGPAISHDIQMDAVMTGARIQF